MVYLDDIIIYSRSEKEHLEHLQEIFTRLKAAGLKLKLEKCCFFKKHIQYLGQLTTSQCNHNTVHTLTTYPTHPKFGTAVTNNLNQKTTPQVRRPVVIVIHIHESKIHVRNK